MARIRITLLPFAAIEERPPLQAGTQHVRLDAIKPRQKDARKLNAPHVVTLAESISVLGLLEPIIIDQDWQLLAGAHRLAALRLLSIKAPLERADAIYSKLQAISIDDNGNEDINLLQNTEGPKKTAEEVILERYDTNGPNSLSGILDRTRLIDTTAFHARYGNKVPVLVVDVQNANGKHLDMAIETAENSVRRQYTKSEIQGLITRLEEVGYTYRNGRPKKGEKTIVAALEEILGKSESQIRRIMKGPTGDRPEWEVAQSWIIAAAKRINKLTADDQTPLGIAIQKAARLIVQAVDAANAAQEAEKSKRRRTIKTVRRMVSPTRRKMYPHLKTLSDD